jgi:hypothetical protein
MEHMHTSAFFFSWILNDHSWYKIDNYWDVARALIWISTNLVTAFCYYAIPWEIYQWRKALPLKSVAVVGFGFILFIVSCGTHHIVDVIIMPTAPWWAIWSVNVPLEISSLATWLVIRNQRAFIISALRSLREIYSNGR